MSVFPDIPGLPDLSFLSDTEKAKIIDVLNRDEQLRRKQTEKYLKLKQEIDLIESKSIDIPSDHIQTANLCVRCRSIFGYFFNKGELCHQCGFKVCQKCRVNQVENGFLFKNKTQTPLWLCILCHKYNQYLVQTGDWIYNSNDENLVSNDFSFSSNEIESDKNRVPLYKKNTSKQRSISSNDSSKTPLSGSQLITLSLFPNKKNEIIQEVESANFKKSTLSKRYSTIKKAKSQSLINDKMTKLNEDNQRKGSESSQAHSFSNTLNSNLASPERSLTPSNYSLNKTNDTNFEKENKPKTFSNIFNFLNNENKSSDLPNSVPNLTGNDFDSVTSSELDNTSMFAPDTNLQLNKNSSKHSNANHQSNYQINDHVQTSTKSSLLQLAYANENSSKINKSNDNLESNSLNRDKSQTSLSKFRNIHEQDHEMNQIDQLFENCRESLKVKQQPKLAYKRDPFKENVPQSVPASPTINSVSRAGREMAVDPVDEYLKLQLEKDKSETKTFGAKSNHMSFIRRPKNPFTNFERTISIKSINEHFTTDPNLKISGRISVKLLYEKKSSNLSVTIYSCENLAMIKKEYPNSYVKVYLKSDENDKEKDKNLKRKTPVVKNNCNPQFDETLRYTISSNDLSGHCLSISVWHKDTFGRNKFLGETLINLSTDLLLNISSSKQWYSLGNKHV